MLNDNMHARCPSTFSYPCELGGRAPSPFRAPRIAFYLAPFLFIVSNTYSYTYLSSSLFTNTLYVTPKLVSDPGDAIQLLLTVRWVMLRFTSTSYNSKDYYCCMTTTPQARCYICNASDFDLSIPRVLRYAVLIVC